MSAAPPERKKAPARNPEGHAAGAGAERANGADPPRGERASERGALEAALRGRRSASARRACFRLRLLRVSLAVLERHDTAGAMAAERIYSGRFAAEPM